MNLFAVGTRRGCQTPRVRVEPQRAYTNGDNAAGLAAAYASPLDPWQRDIINCWLGRDQQGHLTAMTCGLSVPRQNGKNAIIESFELFMLTNVPNTHILHTAHQVRTSKKAFNRLASIFENPKHKELKEQVANIRRTNGEESIILKNGNTIEYCARSRNAARGFDAITVIVYDEAQELTDEQVEALASTMSASPTGDRQAIYAGTPPKPGSIGEVFRRKREAALHSPAQRTAWHEWGVDGPLPVDKSKMTYADVKDLVWATNPAMGVRLDDIYTEEEEFNSMAADGFARERLGWWAPVASSLKAIPRKLWESSAIPAIGNKYRAKTCLAVKFSPDGSRYALAGCKMDSNRRTAVELIETGSTANGTKQLASSLVSRFRTVCCVVVDGSSGAPALCNNIAELNPPRNYIVRPNPRQVAEAASLFYDGLKAGAVAHTATGQAELDLSALGATKRKIGSGDGWGFGSSKESDSMAIEAASLALLGIHTSKRNPKRKQRML